MILLEIKASFEGMRFFAFVFFCFI